MRTYQTSVNPSAAPVARVGGRFRKKEGRLEYTCVLCGGAARKGEETAGTPEGAAPSAESPAIYNYDRFDRQRGDTGGELKFFY